MKPRKREKNNMRERREKTHVLAYPFSPPFSVEPYYVASFILEHQAYYSILKSSMVATRQNIKMDDCKRAIRGDTHT